MKKAFCKEKNGEYFKTSSKLKEKFRRKRKKLKLKKELQTKRWENGNGRSDEWWETKGRNAI